jgi:hypothetical protein
MASATFFLAISAAIVLAFAALVGCLWTAIILTPLQTNATKAL